MKCRTCEKWDETASGATVPEGRIRYHTDNILVHVPLDETGRAAVREAVQLARSLQATTTRPPVTDNEQRCVRCSLAPVCLPEEARLSQDQQQQAVRLFPYDDERQILHVLESGTRVGRSGEQLKIARRGEPTETVPARQIAQLALHSFAQISTQALYFCIHHAIGVHFISGGGRYVGNFDPRGGSVQRRIRQYEGLSHANTGLHLARRLVRCRGQSQRKFLMRGKRNRGSAPEGLQAAASDIQRLLRQVDRASSLEALLGLEGQMAARYFDAFPDLIARELPPELQFQDRSRRPPTDRVNALLSFGYALLIGDVNNAILTVGLEPALGFYHQPRTQAPPLALDLMEIFRVPLVDMLVVRSLNRQQWDPQADFEVRGNQVWLSESGRRKFAELYETRKRECWKHPIMGYSLTYRRLLELEVRLLEKEWSGEGGLFGQLVVR